MLLWSLNSQIFGTSRVLYELTGDDPWFDAGDLDGGDVLNLRRLMGFLQQVPNLHVSILLPDEEDCRPRLGPVAHRALLL